MGLEPGCQTYSSSWNIPAYTPTDDSWGRWRRVAHMETLKKVLFESSLSCEFNTHWNVNQRIQKAGWWKNWQRKGSKSVVPMGTIHCTPSSTEKYTQQISLDHFVSWKRGSLSFSIIFFLFKLFFEESLHLQNVEFHPNNFMYFLLGKNLQQLRSTGTTATGHHKASGANRSP